MPSPAPQVGEIIAGKYRVESVLGRGGMGVVFAARHTISERRVAVKWMEADLHGEPDALERFVREARAMGRIEHANVVGVLDVGTEGEVAYLVMEILRGESLRALMTREQRVPAASAIATLLPALEGVEAAHRAGVVHRDLKPENLFVVRGASGEAVTTKVLDFGISKLTESESKKREARRLTKTGHVVGTPTYMSPEQVRGTDIDARTDVWALATILYEMLAARTPFDGDNYGALLVAIAVEPYLPLDPNVVPPDLARVIHKGLAKEPEDRWQTVQDFARALEPFAHGATFHEPRRHSLVPNASEPARASGAPTVDQGGAPTKPSDPVSVDMPPLDLPLARTAAAARETPASPAPIRMQRPASSASAETPAAPNRRMMTIAAVAFALVIGLVLVIRGLGRAARDAMLVPDAATAQPVATTPTAPEPEPAARVEPPTSEAPSTSAVQVAPPPASVAPPASMVQAPAPHARRDGTRPHASTVAAPEATTAPPPSTATSRSGSIRREDF